MGGPLCPLTQELVAGSVFFVNYVWFSLGFVAIHLGAYIVAGAVSLRFTRDLYTGDGALFAPFLRDVATPEEKARQGLVMGPAQLARGLLMSVVLYPVLTPLAELPLAARFGFLTALMFVYTDLAAATRSRTPSRARLHEEEVRPT